MDPDYFRVAGRTSFRGAWGYYGGTWRRQPAPGVQEDHYRKEICTGESFVENINIEHRMGWRLVSHAYVESGYVSYVLERDDS